MQNSPSAGVQERRDARQPAERFIGNVVSCDGSHATVAATIDHVDHFDVVDHDVLAHSYVLGGGEAAGCEIEPDRS